MKHSHEYPGLWPVDDLYAQMSLCHSANKMIPLDMCGRCDSLWSLQWAYKEWQRDKAQEQQKHYEWSWLTKEGAKKGHVTKRRAPTGYAAVTRPLAFHLYEAGKQVTLCGNNVNSFHVFGGWFLGCTIAKPLTDDYECPQLEKDMQFFTLSNDFLSYMDKELGRYVVYYVKRSDLP